MEEFDSCYKQLRQSVKEGIRDHSLTAALNKCIENIKLEPALVQLYSAALFKLYDLSNSSFFIARPPPPQSKEPVLLDPLAVAIKIIVLKMLGALVVFFNDNPNLELPSQILFESLEMMVMLSRVLLDLGKIGQVREIYALVMTFREAVGQVLSVEAELAHWLNIVELFELDVDSRKLDFSEFQKAVREIESLCSKNQPPQGYLTLVHHLTFMVILKLLKKGQNLESKSLVHFLPEKLKVTVTQLMSIDSKAFADEQSGLKISPFYELYLQIKNAGIENIAQQNLRLFLGKEEYFNDARLFDVVALTGEVLPLELWLELHLNRKNKSEQLQAAYKCFLFLVDQTLEETNFQSGSLVDQCVQKEARLCKLLRVAKIVMISLLGEKKDSAEPILNIIKRLFKLLIHLILSLHSPPEQLQQYTEKLLLLCTKHNLHDMNRSVTCIHFYYQIIMGVVTEESYTKFYKTNLMDKGSELFRMLKLAYQFRVGKPIDPEQERELLNKEPYIMVLFATQPHQQLILRIPPAEMGKMRQKWEVYLLLIQGEDRVNEDKLNKILVHLEETLIQSDWSQLSELELSYLGDITGYFLSALKEETQLLSSKTKVQLSLVLLYLVTIRPISTKLAVLNESILLNRYSKVLKLLSLSQDELPNLPSSVSQTLLEKQIFLSKSYLCNLLQTTKIAYLQGQVSLETGQMLFIDLLKEMIFKEESQQICEFFNFVRFEILSICDCLPVGQLTYESNPKLLKLYCSSKYIKKQIKLKIMRKLIREDLISDSKLLTLSDLNELIDLAETPQEKSIFAQYIVRTFGEEGKKYLMLQSSKDPEGYSFLYNQHMELDEQ